MAGGTLDLGGTTQAQNGGVTLAGGTIQNGTLSSSGIFNMQSGMVSAVLAGTGALSQTTAGSAVLTGANTYTGGTTISAGTLALSGAGSIASSSQVTISNSGIFDISGTLAGARITTLAGAAGSTVALGSQTLSISNGSTTFAGSIQGTGGLTLMGGTETSSGANNYGGSTTINAGRLQVDGSIASSATTVNSGGTLSGSGTVGAVTVKSGGTFEPGPIGTRGTMTVAGNLAFQSGARCISCRSRRPPLPTPRSLPTAPQHSRRHGRGAVLARQLHGDDLLAHIYGRRAQRHVRQFYNPKPSAGR